MDKKEIRKKHIAMRNAMAKDQVQELSGAICNRIIESELFLKADQILVYYPLGNEVDVRLAIVEAWKQGKKTAFPKVHGDIMRFYEVTGFDELTEGAFHVMEPEEGEEALWTEALMLVPGVAFDRTGNRMGFGKGYYDKYLESHGKPVTLGIAYEQQLEEKLLVEEHDQPLDYMVTEKGLWNTNCI